MQTNAALTHKLQLIPPNRPVNQFLARSTGGEREQFLPDLREIRKAAGDVLFRADEPAPEVFFPIDCVVAVSSAPGDGVDVALVGPEGVLTPGPAGSAASLFNAVIQVPGRLAVADARAFHAWCEASATCRRLLESWHHALLFQSQQIAACNAIHDVEKRLCRWLLQFHARTRLGMLPVTQEMLANMLGVQRTTVTLVAHRLRNKGVLRQRRGRIEILDMTLLEQSACDCHRRIERAYAAVMSPSSERSQLEG
jgi:CRP-like cAMP-binding protein